MIVYFKTGQPRPLFHLPFSEYCTDTFSCQQDLNLDCRSRRQGPWPIYYHHGPICSLTNIFFHSGRRHITEASWAFTVLHNKLSKLECSKCFVYYLKDGEPFLQKWNRSLPSPNVKKQDESFTYSNSWSEKKNLRESLSGTMNMMKNGKKRAAAVDLTAQRIPSPMVCQMV